MTFAEWDNFIKKLEVSLHGSLAFNLMRTFRAKLGADRMLTAAWCAVVGTGGAGEGCCGFRKGLCVKEVTNVHVDSA